MNFQLRVQEWLLACFGSDRLANKREGSFRFIEESLELVQASGLSKDDALKMVEYVYSRPPGETYQEVGGVVITLHALAIVLDHDIDACGEVELQRCWKNIEKIRAKQMAKELKG